MPVGIRARPPPGASTAPSRATRSTPASPGRACWGSGRSGSRRRTGICTRWLTGDDARPLRCRGGAGEGCRWGAAMLVWMDLEMTGLDPARHVIVEIATIVTGDHLEVVAEGPDLVVHQPPEALAAMEDVVREMHTASGLLAAIEASTTTL